MSNSSNPYNLVAFGPDANCTLALCTLEDSVLQYRPSLAASGIFIALFSISLLLHIAQGIAYRQWTYMSCMILGCVTEIVGYCGRIVLYQNPFSFTGFMIQIVTITFGPVFYSAAIYITLGRITRYLSPEISRLPTYWYYYIFITCDIIALVLQGTGGGMSTSTSGSSKTAVDIAIAGLSSQVVTLVIFIGLCVDFAVRYSRSAEARADPGKITPKFKVFVTFLSLAVILILIRCCYRIAELKDGYTGGGLIHNQGLFIGLESCLVIFAVYCLNVSHPGPVFSGKQTQAVQEKGLSRSIGNEEAEVEK